MRSWLLLKPTRQIFQIRQRLALLQMNTGRSRETAEERHEYCNGEILAISGGSEVRRAIGCNLMSLPIDSDDRVVWRLAQ